MINPAHFDLQSLRVFQLVAQCGGLTQAANKSHMTLSALSKRIADLERTVGCALFLRVRRGLELTPAGHELVQHARMVLDKVNQMAGEMSDFATGVRGHVKVWANTSAVIQFLPHDLASFLASQPMIRISLEERLSQDVVVALLSGETDIGVFADNVPAYDIRKSVYRRDRLVVLVPAGHPLAGRSEVSFDETLEYDFVGLNQGSSLLQRLTDAASALDKVVRLRIQVSSFDAICRMIEAGLGIGVLPDGAVRPELLGAGLHAVYLSDAWASRILWLGVRDEAGLLPEARTLLEHLRAAGSASASR
ncbi:HTH-type transcriptional regulator GltC [compost metagenome]|jgi:DNA-binding transcriptional LysR family regulator|uniref:LysR family transcriptional regulator n=1 Tax=Cupriavidus necator TaxID=106590 RepID=A0A1K0IBZ2_CUPNE|nr:LysR family transcriptional regulator [Cupriavidus sp. SK-4]EYS85274.1 GntR family transcriptional regulator [Cupriavidus sp. SK-4]SCU74339.1 LysR family transcriptional regulator [Cupriavidus necator]